MEDQLSFYKTHGYLVVPGALSAREVQALNAAIDRDRADNQPFWMDRKNGRHQTVHILLAQPEFDLTMRPPGLLPLMEAILGEDICAEEHSVMIRAANPGGPTECGWHRDAGGPADPPYYTRRLSVIFYLTDVDETTHAFAVLPGSGQSTDLPPLETYDLTEGKDLIGPAGTAILFNARMIHAGNVRQTPVERRTVHIYCGLIPDRPLSNFTIFPRRLSEGRDKATQKYYGRPNPISKLLRERF